MSDDPLTRRPDDDLSSTARVLANSIGGLSVQVQRLHDRIGRIATKAHWNRVAIVLLCIVLATTVVLASSYYRTSSCQLELNQMYQAAATQLREASDRTRAAQLRLFDVTLNPASTPDQRRQASVDYRESLIEYDVERTVTPFPNGGC